MKLLLDTHIALWAFSDSNELSKQAKELISDPNNDIYYSVASMWEVTIKHMLHPDRMLISGSRFSSCCNSMGFSILSIQDSHVRMLETLKRAEHSKPHNDPFDRILIAQAKAEGILFVTHDSLIPDYTEDCILPV